MPRKKQAPTPAQIAHQVTWRLQGDLKRKQLAYLRIGEQLTRVRDEKLWQVLKFDSIESWAEQRLGLGRTSLYQYLQIYGWVKERHPEWLKPNPKGFIPELSDVAVLRTIEERLEGRLSSERRKTFEALREKALSGKLAREEYTRAARPGKQAKPPLRAFAARLRALVASARRVSGLDADVVADLAAILSRVDALSRTHTELARIAPKVSGQLAALGLREFTTMRA